MSDVLSPDEVDALLEGVSKGEISKASASAAELEVTEYDLTATDHIVRSDLPSMELLNQGIARYLKSSFRRALRDGIDTRVGDITEVKFSDYIASLPEPTMIYLIQISTLNSRVLCVLSPELIRKYVDIYFGGGTKVMEPAPRDGFTSAEARVSEQILGFALADFVAGWNPIVPIQASMSKSEWSPGFCKFMESAEPVVVNTFTVQLDEDSQGSLSWVIPSSMLAPLYEKMDASNRGSQSEERARWTAALKERLLDVELTLSATLAQARLSLGNLVRLQAHDIIPIEIEKSVPVAVGGAKLFHGKYGTSKGKNAVEIHETL